MVSSAKKMRAYRLPLQASVFSQLDLCLEQVPTHRPDHKHIVVLLDVWTLLSAMHHHLGSTLTHIREVREH